MTREALWLALSELWLDTELQAFQHAHIARVLQDSDLPLEEIEAILLYEVAPVVWRNAQCVAGVWAGFDRSWLTGACHRNQQKRGKLWHRLRCRLLRKLMLGPVKEDWQKVKDLLLEDQPAGS